MLFLPSSHSKESITASLTFKRSKFLDRIIIDLLAVHRVDVQHIYHRTKQSHSICLCCLTGCEFSLFGYHTRHDPRIHTGLLCDADDVVIGHIGREECISDLLGLFHLSLDDRSNLAEDILGIVLNLRPHRIEDIPSSISRRISALRKAATDIVVEARKHRSLISSIANRRLLGGIKSLETLKQPTIYSLELVIAA